MDALGFSAKLRWPNLLQLAHDFRSASGSGLKVSGDDGISAMHARGASVGDDDKGYRLGPSVGDDGTPPPPPPTLREAWPSDDRNAHSLGPSIGDDGVPCDARLKCI